MLSVNKNHFSVNYPNMIDNHIVAIEVEEK